MAIPAMTTAALLSAPLVVLLVLFGHMATSAPTDVCLEGCVCYKDYQKLRTLNCTSFKPVLNAASSLLSDFSHIDVLNVKDVEDGSNDFIFDGLFGVFSNIKYMNLINASITKIYPNAFKGLKNLKELDLSKNKIYKFSQETFQETPSLKVLDLSNNPLRLSPNTFLFSRSLEGLALSSCNLTSVPSGSFKGLPNLKSLDLYDNQIQSFTYRSFPRSLNHLWLTKNNLTNILTKAITSLNKLTTLDISENPINCTCSLIGLQDWFSSKGILFENDVICYYPIRYRGKSWSKVPENDVCVDDTTIINEKTEETSGNSCEDEICEENTIDTDRYAYNAVQADQPTSEDTTDIIGKVDADEGKENSTPITISKEDGNDTKQTNIGINKIEGFTEVPQSSEKVTMESEKIENMIKELTTMQTSVSIEDLTRLPEESLLEKSPLETENKIENEILTSTSSTDQGEAVPTISPITSVDQTKNLVVDDTTTLVPTQLIETTTPDISAKSSYSDILETTTKTEISSISPAETPTEQQKEENSLSPITTIATPEEPQTPEINYEVTEVTKSEQEQSQTTTERVSSDVSGSDLAQSTTSDPQTTTLLLPEKGLSVNPEDATATTTTESTTNIADLYQGKNNNETLTSSGEVTTTVSTPTAGEVTLLPTHHENIEEKLETTTLKILESTFIPTVPTTLITPDKINYVPQSTEDVIETTTVNAIPKEIIQEKELTSEPTNKTEAIVVLPSTNNREGKMMSTQNEETHKDVNKKEAMGSYIVLGGIIIALLLLILYASTKKRRQPDRNKKPLNDPEGNMTELQDMTSLLPSSPVVNGHKNNKYPNEEPSVTAKLLDTDDQPDSNGNGFIFPQDNHPPVVQNETPEKIQKSNGNSTLPRTNGSSSGPPPLELTKARVVVLPESIPRTPIYIQKNVNS